METLLKNIGIYLITLLVLSLFKSYKLSFELETENFYSQSNQISSPIDISELSPTPVSISLDSIINKTKEVNEAKIALIPKISELKFLLVGDSMIQGAVGVQIEKRLLDYQVVDVYRFGKPSTGMSRPDFFNWNKKTDEILKDYSPDVVIVMFGANDGQGIWVDKKWVKLDDPLWEATYERKVEEFSQKFFDSNVKNVYWIGNSISRYEYYSEYMKKINNALISYSQKKENFIYISTWEDFSDSSGNYIHFTTTPEGSKKVLRAEDGIHFTNDGGKVIADEVVEKLKEKFRF